MNRSEWARRKIKSRSGFTLIELLIVIALMAIISIPVSASLIFGVKVFNSETAVDAVYQDQLSAFNEIKESMRRDPAHVKVVMESGVPVLQIGETAATRRDYFLQDGNLNRRIDTDSQVLCSNITAFDLTIPKAESASFLSTIRITLTATVNNRVHTLESNFSLRRYSEVQK